MGGGQSAGAGANLASSAMSALAGFMGGGGAEGDLKKTPCVTTEVGRGERDRMMPSHKSSSGLHTVGVPTIDCTKVGVPTIDCTKSDRLSDSQACLRAHCVVSSPCIYRLEIATF